MKKPLLFLLFLSVLLNFPSFSLVLPEDYLKEGIGVRPLGMGGAFTAVPGDLNSAFYNPAGLDTIPPFNYVYGDLDYSKDRSNADSYSAFNMGSLCFAHIGRESATGQKVQSTYYSFGVKSAFGLSYGLTYKDISWANLPANGAGYSSDLGVMCRMTPDLTLGLLCQDLAYSKSLNVPSTTRIGFSYRLLNDNIMLSADTESGRITPGNYTYYGAEWKTSNVFILRAGSYQGRSTLGFGIAFGAMDIDYAVVYDDSVASGSVHRFSIGTNFEIKKERPFSIMRPKEFALIEIGGSLTGGIGEFSLLGGGKLGADAVIANINEAVDDPYVDGIILKIRSFDGGIGSVGIVQEIRRELMKAKDRKKIVIAYIESSALGDEYYLASVADYVVAPPNSDIGGLGRTIGITRIKGLLEKIGVESQVLVKGRYKNALSMFEEGLTRDQEKMMRILIADLYRQMVDDISLSRKNIKAKKMKEISDGSIFSANKAKELGLIDDIGYFKDAAKGGAKLLGDDKDPTIVKREGLFVRGEGEFLFAFPNKIAVIEIDGDIITGKSGQNVLFGGKATGSDTIVEQIKKASDDWQVKAIVVRINSGGGSAIASRQIYDELLKAKEKGKTVVASMGDLGASGGYYIACASDRIVANPGTITGSIGVIGARILIIKDLLDKIGVKVETVKEGRHSDMFSGLRKLSTSEIQSLSYLLEETYDDFVSAVARGRGLTTAEVRDVAEGRIYTGSQAKDLDLVDKLGNFTDAVDEASRLSGIAGKPKLVYYREESFWLGMGTGAIKMMGLENGLFPQLGSELAEYRLY